jgi:hypothetical protein
MILPYDDENRSRSAKYDQIAIYSEKALTINFENYDISSICNGHLFYRMSLDKILDTIDFDF